MLGQLAGWEGTIEYNGNQYNNIKELSSLFKAGMGNIHIKLYPKGNKPENKAGNAVQAVDNDHTQYKVFVKQYMTKKANPGFDFMLKYNNDVPMPYRIMVGEKVKETRGMVYMKLHADITEECASMCMCCGRALTNPVSKYFGIGPECGGHNYVHPFDTDEELREAVNAYREKLREVKWEGWIIKSAIVEEEVM